MRPEPETTAAGSFDVEKKPEVWLDDRDKLLAKEAKFCGGSC
jgi:hypothetical protein